MKKRIAFALLMGIITTCIISFTLVSVNVGYTNNFIVIWLRSWAIAYAIAVPAVLYLGPQVQRWIEHWFREREMQADAEK